MPDVVIGMDPHKHSATIEIIDTRERVLEHGRFATTTTGYRAMLAAGRRYPRRRWAIEGCNGIGRHIAQRLVADGEKVVDVPSKLSAQVRVFATGQGRTTDPIDAHSVAVAALRSTGLREVAADDATVALRLLVDRRDSLGRTRTDLVNRLHVFLLDLIPGGRRRTCPPARPAPCCPASKPPTWSGAPAASSPVSWSRRSKPSMRRSRRRTGSSPSWSRFPAARSKRCTASARPARPGCSATSVTSPASPAAGTSRPGTVPRRWTPPPASSAATGSPVRATVASTGSCTSWPSSSCATIPRDAATTTAAWPRARPPWRPCGR